MKAEKVKPKDWLWDANYPIRIVYESDVENYSVIWANTKRIKHWVSVGMAGQVVVIQDKVDTQLGMLNLTSLQSQYFNAC